MELSNLAERSQLKLFYARFAADKEQGYFVVIGVNMW